jgi:hypothetical protein
VLFGRPVWLTEDIKNLSLAHAFVDQIPLFKMAAVVSWSWRRSANVSCDDTIRIAVNRDLDPTIDILDHLDGDFDAPLDMCGFQNRKQIGANYASQ